MLFWNLTHFLIQVCKQLFHPPNYLCRMKQESPVQASKWEVSGGQVSEASSVLTDAPRLPRYQLSAASCLISSGISFHRSMNPNPEVKAEYPEMATNWK